MNDVLHVFSPKMKSRVVVLCSFIIEIHVLIIVLRLFVFWCSFPRFCVAFGILIRSQIQTSFSIATSLCSLLCDRVLSCTYP